MQFSFIQSSAESFCCDVVLRVGKLDIMDVEDLKRMGENPQFIKGIYNYCDRWCERCPFTSRCMNFALSDEHFADQESRDISNEAFWQKLAEMFRVTLELVQETAEREGIDLDSLDTEETAEEERLNEEVVKSHECCRAATVYEKMVDGWFDSVEDLFQPEEDELDSKQRFEIPNFDPVGGAASFEDAVEVVRWYQHQIRIKLMRAARGDLEERPEFLNEFPGDSDGSAKVALIGMDRSMAAWGEIGNHFFVDKGDILDLLVHLDRLRGKIEKAFPDARAFIRPGFDKIDLNS